MSFQRKTKRRMRQITAVALAAAVTVPASSLVATSEVEAAKLPFTFEFQEAAGLDGGKEILITLDRKLAVDGDHRLGYAINTNLIEVTFPARAEVVGVTDKNQLRVQISNIDPTKNYELTLKEGTLRYDDRNQNQFQDYVIPFTPKDLAPTFESIFVSKEPKEINERIFNLNTSEQVRLTSPGSQVTQMTVRHRDAAHGTTITDIELEALQSEVVRITADIYDGNAIDRELGIVESKEFIRLPGEETFKSTFAGLENVIGYDIHIRAFAADGRLLERKVQRIRPNETKTFDIPAIDHSLAELIDNGEQLDGLLAGLTRTRWNNLQVTYPNHHNVARVGSANALITELSKSIVDTIHLTNNFSTGNQTLTIGKDATGTPTIYIDGHGRTITGNVMLGFDESTHMNVYLRNVTITGDLNVNVGRNGKAFLDNVHTNGNYRITSGSEGSIVINDSTGAKMIFQNNTSIRVTLKGASNFNGTDINSASPVTLNDQSENASFGTVDIVRNNADLILQRGHYPQVTVNSENSNVTIRSSATVNTIIGNYDYSITGPLNRITVDPESTKKSGVEITTDEGVPDGGTEEKQPFALTANSVNTITGKSLKENGLAIRIDITDGNAKWPGSSTDTHITGTALSTITGAVTWFAGIDDSGVTVERNRDDRITIVLPKQEAAGVLGGGDIVVDLADLEGLFSGFEFENAPEPRTITVTPSMNLDDIVLDGGLGVTGSSSGLVITGLPMGSNESNKLEYTINTTGSTSGGNWTPIADGGLDVDLINLVSNGETVIIREKENPSNYKVLGTVYNDKVWIGVDGALATVATNADYAGIKEVVLTAADAGDSGTPALVTFTRLVDIDFGEFTYTGDLRFNTTESGSMKLTGTANPSIDGDGGTLAGDVTFDTPNATVTNEIKAAGEIHINGIKVNTWHENAVGNTINFAANGARIVLNGKDVELNVTATNARVEVGNRATVKELKGTGTATVIGAANRIQKIENPLNFTLPAGTILNSGVQTEINKAKEALAKINKALAEDSLTGVSVITFADAGIAGVTVENEDAVKAALEDKYGTVALTGQEMQKVVNTVKAIIGINTAAKVAVAEAATEAVLAALKEENAGIQNVVDGNAVAYHTRLKADIDGTDVGGAGDDLTKVQIQTAITEVNAKVAAITSIDTVRTLDSAELTINELNTAIGSTVAISGNLDAYKAAVLAREAGSLDTDTKISALVVAVNEVETAKAALTTLAFDATNNATHATPNIVKPANHANGATYTLAVSGITNNDNGGNVTGDDPVVITRDTNTEFTFVITVTITDGNTVANTTSTKVFNVSVPTGVEAVTITVAP